VYNFDPKVAAHQCDLEYDFLTRFAAFNQDQNALQIGPAGGHTNYPAILFSYFHILQNILKEEICCLTRQWF
jgi:hypothetical protein